MIKLLTTGNKLMLRLAFLLLLLTSQQVLAAGMWEKTCEKDLALALNIKAGVFRIMHKRHGEFRTELPRSLGIVHAPCIDELIAISKQMHWGENEKFQQRFIAELTWVQTLLNGDIAEVYRQAKLYQALGGEGAVGILATYLNKWAADKKYPPAEFDEVQAMLARSPNQAAIGWLKLVAGKGYAPAMLDAARRFLMGDGVKKNLGAAYYWTKRAEAAHGDLSGIIEKPYERLLDQMNDDEKESLARSLRFYGPLK